LSRVSSLKERKIIELIHQCLEDMPETPVPFGDDASAVNMGGDVLAVLTVDMLVGKTDVPPGMTLYQAARKAVVMNINDLASKGVKPLAVLASLGLPRGLSAEDVKEIGRGLNAGAREYGSYVIGGDTNESSDLIIDCVAFGTVNRRYFVGRDGAKPGDIVAVTGFFGNTSCGFKILLDGFYAPKELKEKLLKSIYEPKAKVNEGVALSRSRYVTASIDSSDGLAWSLHEISKASGVGFLIEDLHASPEAKAFARIHGLDLIDLCLYGGEEYELIVTVKPEKWFEAESLIAGLGSSLMRIGVVTEERSIRLSLNGELIPIEPRGWEHFK